MKERWEFKRSWCDGCDKEMLPVLEARCTGRMFEPGLQFGAVVKCRNPKCDKREFVWDITV